MRLYTQQHFYFSDNHRLFPIIRKAGTFSKKNFLINVKLQFGGPCFGDVPHQSLLTVVNKPNESHFQQFPRAGRISFPECRIIATIYLQCARQRVTLLLLLTCKIPLRILVMMPLRGPPEIDAWTGTLPNSQSMPGEELHMRHITPHPPTPAKKSQLRTDEWLIRRALGLFASAGGCRRAHSETRRSNSVMQLAAASTYEFNWFPEHTCNLNFENNLTNQICNKKNKASISFNMRKKNLQVDLKNHVTVQP